MEQAASGTYDVVVVGSGAAGLSAALSASVGGARVGVVERASVLGGTTAISGGGMWLPCTSFAKELGFEDSPGEVKTYLNRLAVGRTTSELIDAFTDAAPRAFEMLRANTVIEFDMSKIPDYQMGLPGAKASGRALWVGLYDANRLGNLPLLVRDTPEPGGMPPLTSSEVTHSSWGFGESGDAWLELAGQRRRDNIFGKGRSLIGALVEACAANGVEFHVNARAIDLLVESGRVVGVEALVDDSSREYHANRGVVLASGGFEWNSTMWRELIGVPLDGPVSAPGAEGDGLQMAMRMGARIANTGEVWWMPGVAVENEVYDGQPRLRMGATGKSLPGAIVVNATGRRFANESMNYNDFGKSMVQFDAQTYTFPNYPAFVITDSQHRERYPPIAYDTDRHWDKQWLTEAPGLRELAEKLGIDPDGLGAQVEEFNKGATEGVDPQFRRGQPAYDSSSNFGGALAPLTKPPFYGYTLRVSCLGTKGGPVINGKAQVVDYADQPIPGLYAAGNTAAAVFGTAYPGGGATIGAALVFGYLAGRTLSGAMAFETRPVAAAADG